ncbi:MAG TPA: 6-bladed beta-propeller, partial [bacterium]|nr:6-bladed beta-propeller [bacterium]
DAVNQNVEKFDDSGNLITSWSTQGAWDAAASDPDGIVCDKWGNVYTPDYNNFCVYKYTDTGTFEGQIGERGSGPGQFGSLSCGICVDAKGILYVSDYSYRRVSEFSLDGKYLCQWGNSGPGALGNFDYFCLGPSGDAYVEDNNTIKVFGP